MTPCTTLTTSLTTLKTLYSQMDNIRAEAVATGNTQLLTDHMEKVKEAQQIFEEYEQQQQQQQQQQQFNHIVESIKSWNSYENFQGYINPTTVDWNNLIKTSKEQTAVKNSFTLNPETLNLNFENITPFIPDTSKYIGKPLGEVFAEIIKQYGKTHYIPGFEYQQWCRENPGKIPRILKDGNYYYTPGTVLGRSDGRVSVPCGRWFGGEWNRYDGWVEFDWRDRGRVLLLPRIES